MRIGFAFTTTVLGLTPVALTVVENVTTLVTADVARSTTLKRRVDDAAGARPFRRACTRAAGAARAPTLKQI